MNRFVTKIFAVALMASAGLVGCKSNDPINPNTAIKEPINPQTLIVYYEQGAKETTLQAIQALGGELVYEYDRIYGIVIFSDYPKTTIERLNNTKGVLSAEVSQIYTP